jgi:hypothetical protein
VEDWIQNRLEMEQGPVDDWVESSQSVIAPWVRYASAGIDERVSTFIENHLPGCEFVYVRPAEAPELATASVRAGRVRDHDLIVLEGRDIDWGDVRSQGSITSVALVSTSRELIFYQDHQLGFIGGGECIVEAAVDSPHQAFWKDFHVELSGYVDEIPDDQDTRRFLRFCDELGVDFDSSGISRLSLDESDRSHGRFEELLEWCDEHNAVMVPFAGIPMSVWPEMGWNVDAWWVTHLLMRLGARRLKPVVSTDSLELSVNRSLSARLPEFLAQCISSGEDMLLESSSAPISLFVSADNYVTVAAPFRALQRASSIDPLIQAEAFEWYVRQVEDAASYRDDVNLEPSRLWDVYRRVCESRESARSG